MLGTSSKLSHLNLTVVPPRRPRCPKPYIGVLSGWGSSAVFGCFTNTLENAKCALLERVYYHSVGSEFAPPMIPRVSDVYDGLREVTRFFRSVVRVTAPVDILAYPKLSYTGRKLAIYQRAAELVHRRGVSRRDAHLKSFVKVEKIQLKPKRLVPRIIQPRAPEYNVAVGRYIKHLEHAIYGHINDMFDHMVNRHMGGPTVMKGLNCFQQAQAMRNAWDSFAQPTAIMLDAVRFDQHVSRPMLEWEHSIYGLFYRGRDRADLMKLLLYQLHNVGRVDTAEGTIKYEVDGCRMSGDMNTAMGNCLIMSSCVYSLLRKLCIRGHLFNNGDDCCILVENRDAKTLTDAVKPFFEQLGFIIDVEGTTHIFEEISFCQTHPVYDGSLWRMVRDPRLVLSKDTTILKKWSKREWSAYWVALGKCGLALTYGLPIFQSFYSAMLKFGDGEEFSEGLLRHVGGAITESGMWQMSRGLDTRVSEITPSARASFALAFKTLPQVQYYFEEYFNQITPCGNRMDFHPERRIHY